MDIILGDILYLIVEASLDANLGVLPGSDAHADNVVCGDAGLIDHLAQAVDGVVTRCNNLDLVLKESGDCNTVIKLKC